MSSPFVPRMPGTRSASNARSECRTGRSSIARSPRSRLPGPGNGRRGPEAVARPGNAAGTAAADTASVDVRLYRSYVIRVWQRRGGGDVETRIVVEEVQSGRQAEMRGRAAALLAATVAATLDAATEADAVPVTRSTGE